MALKVSRKHYHKGKLCSKKSWTYFLVLSGYLAEYRQNLIYGPNIPDSYVILFFTALYFIFTTRHIHNWTSLPLCPSHLILYGAGSNWPLLFSSNILDTFQPGDSSSGVIFSCLFIPFMRFSRQEYWSSLPSPSPVAISWVAPHGMAHSFTELCKPLDHDKAVIHEGVSTINYV